MAHDQAFAFVLRLQAHNRLEKIATIIGFQGAAIGNPQFNASFLVKTNNKTKAKQFFNEELQQDLLRLLPRNPELAITKSSIVLTTSFLDRADDFQALVDIGRLLCHRIKR